MVYRGGRGSRLDDECASPFSEDNGGRATSIIEEGAMRWSISFGLDVSVKATSVCVVDDAGKVILEQKVATDPADIIAVLTSLGVSFGRIGIEAARPQSHYRQRKGTRTHHRCVPRPPRYTICRFSQRTFAGARGSERDAPLTAIQPVVDAAV